VGPFRMIGRQIGSYVAYMLAYGYVIAQLGGHI